MNVVVAGQPARSCFLLLPAACLAGRGGDLRVRGHLQPGILQAGVAARAVAGHLLPRLALPIQPFATVSTHTW